jgi:hypothetical protein
LQDCRIWLQDFMIEGYGCGFQDLAAGLQDMAAGLKD